MDAETFRSKDESAVFHIANHSREESEEAPNAGGTLKFRKQIDPEVFQLNASKRKGAPNDVGDMYSELLQ